MEETPDLVGWSDVPRQPVGMPGQKTLFDLHSSKSLINDAYPFLSDLEQQMAFAQPPKQLYLWEE
ncbi:MAG: hypothetical protein P8N76_24285 [Pirellulaceae bacterium]|nr:hypothetical protein [Pirellulaceae bacterium]